MSLLPPLPSPAAAPAPISDHYNSRSQQHARLELITASSPSAGAEAEDFDATAAGSAFRGAGQGYEDQTSAGQRSSAASSASRRRHAQPGSGGSTSHPAPSPSSSGGAAPAAAAPVRSGSHREAVDALHEASEEAQKERAQEQVDRLVEETMGEYQGILQANAANAEQSAVPNASTSQPSPPSQPKRVFGQHAFSPSTASATLGQRAGQAAEDAMNGGIPSGQGMKTIRVLHASVQNTLGAIQNKTSQILQDQERDLLRSFKTRLMEVSEELEKERKKNESGSVEWVARCRKLTEELDWSVEPACQRHILRREHRNRILTFCSCLFVI
jgi:hypothetical protein